LTIGHDFYQFSSNLTQSTIKKFEFSTLGDTKPDFLKISSRGRASSFATAPASSGIKLKGWGVIDQQLVGGLSRAARPQNAFNWGAAPFIFK